jgi:Transposase zinc-binding domain/Putative transposase
MATPPLAGADLCRQDGPASRDTPGASRSPQQHRARRASARWRTAALGGHVEPCAHGGPPPLADHSCPNHHGPKCPSLATAQWVAERRGARVPVESCHVVLTLPAARAPRARHTQRGVDTLLFQAAAHPVRRLAADPQPLGARLGVLALRHPWGPPLRHHPYRHGVVPGGGWSPDGPRGSAGRPGFLLPVRVLSRVCRRVCVEGWQPLFAQGR